MNPYEAGLLGIIEGLTEFLPVSSTAHLTVTEKLLGFQIDAREITAFTATVQIGSILAALIYFRADILRLAGAWFRGLVSAEARAKPDYRMAWLVIVGSLPIGIVGLLAEGVITGPLRNLWVIVVALLAWSAVIVFAERTARRSRGEDSITLTDVLIIGGVQSLALIPGVSRSGATISIGLMRGLDRVSATRLSFLLSIPAITAAGLYELPKALTEGVGWLPTLVGAVVSFVVAYAAITWMLAFVKRNSLTWFVPYRVLLALVVGGLLLSGVLTAT